MGNSTYLLQYNRRETFSVLKAGLGAIWTDFLCMYDHYIC